MSWAGLARRVVAITVCTAVLGTLTATAARADDPPSGSQIPAAALDLWPAHLRFLVPGTDEFNARYQGAKRQQLEAPLADDSPAKAARTDPSCADKGGDVGLYTVDFTRHLGDILNALQLLPGQDKLGFVTTPWPGPPADQAPDGKNDGGVMPLPGGGYRYDDDDQQSAHLPDPAYIRSCAQDLAGFGKADPESPWGFDFYGEPDEGSVDAMHSMLAQIPARTRTVGGHEQLLSGTASWDYIAGYLSKWAYNPAAPMSYCKSGDDPNPWCITAMFLHCPDVPAASDPSFQAVKDCQQFNANTVLINVAVANWMNLTGQDGRFHDWLLRIHIGDKWPTIRKWLLTGLAVAGGLYIGAASGAIAAFGLRKVLLGVAAGAALTATDSWDTIWGVVTCSADVGKCLAKAAASGMAQATDLVAQTATKQDLPSLQSASSVFNSLAGLSGVVMLILLLLTLCAAVLTGRMGMILPASVGVVRWGIGIGAGSTILTMVWMGSTYAADAIAAAGKPSGSSGSTISQFASGLSQDAIGAGALKIVGWVLVALLCLIGLICAVIVWIVINLSDGFIPLAVALMIVQMSGATGSETAQRWIHRGWGLLWTILLLRPVVTLVAKMATVNAASETVAGLISGVALLAIAAVAPWLIVAMFPTVASGTVGAMRGLFGAAQGTQAMAGMLGSARRGMGAIGRATNSIGNRASQLGRLVAGAGSGGGHGPGPGQVRPATGQPGPPKNPSGSTGGVGGGKFGPPAGTGSGTGQAGGQTGTPTSAGTGPGSGQGTPAVGGANGPGQQPVTGQPQPGTGATATNDAGPGGRHADSTPAPDDPRPAASERSTAGESGTATADSPQMAVPSADQPQEGADQAAPGNEAAGRGEATGKRGGRTSGTAGRAPTGHQDRSPAAGPAGDGQAPKVPAGTTARAPAALPVSATSPTPAAVSSGHDADPGGPAQGPAENAAVPAGQPSPPNAAGPAPARSSIGTPATTAQSPGTGAPQPPPAAASGPAATAPAADAGASGPAPSAPAGAPSGGPSAGGPAAPSVSPAARADAGQDDQQQGQQPPAAWQDQPGQPGPAGPSGWTPRPGQGYRPGRHGRRPQDNRSDRGDGRDRQ